MLQPLERRRMFAISVAAGLATINGTASDDVIEVILQSGKINVRNGAGTITDSVNSAGVTKIAVNGGGGNDFIRLGRNDGTLMPNLPSTLSGGAGNDTIIGGNKADQIFGGNNNDRIDGRAGGDRIDGGTGFDTADYSYRTVPITVTLINSGTANDGSNTGDNSAPGKYNDNGADNCVDIENVVGGTAADKITGNDSANWLDGSGGNDSIYGLAGVDTITGGVNNDLGYGGTQDDFFFMKDVAADQFLGEGGLTSAQYDSGVDSPAPAQAQAKAAKAKALAAISAAAPLSASDNLILDETFGPDNDGKVTTIIDGIAIQINDVTIQHVLDGNDNPVEKIIAVGQAYSTTNPYSNSGDFVVIRYNSNGDIDTTFGPDETGIVYTDFSPVILEGRSNVGTNGVPFDYGTNDAANSVIIDYFGNIVVAGNSAQPYTSAKPGVGTSTASGSTSVYAVARYDANGNLDSNFNDDGKFTYYRNNYTTFDVATRIAEQVYSGEGVYNSYVVGGTVGPDSEDSRLHDFGIIRINGYDGSMDTDFGLKRADFGNPFERNNEDYLSGLTVDPLYNGIWATGTTTDEFGDIDFGIVGLYEWGDEISGSMQIIDFGGDDQATSSVFDGTQVIIAGTSTTYSGEVASYVGVIAGVTIEYPVSRSGAPITNEAPPPTNLITRIISTDSDALFLGGITLDNDGHAIVVGSDGSKGFFVQQLNTSDLTDFGEPTIVDFGSTDDNLYDTALAAGVQMDGQVVVVGANDSYDYLEMARLVHNDGEVWVDIPISDTEVQNFPFTYIDENGNTQPVPTYLVWRDTALKPDGTLDVSGGALGDVILIDQKGEFITITKNGEILQIPKEFVTKIVVNGGDGGDLIWTSEYVQVPVIIDGGKGGDTITGGNKKDSIYGGEGDDRIAAGDGNDFVDCGKGNDIALGGFGNDSVLGGDGRDILIGGDGVDTLKGGAGEDAILAGGTKYTYTPEIFEQIRKEWARTDVSYATRVSHLVNGGGLNGAYLLNKFTVTSGKNVSDVLSGEADKDAFWANLTLPGDKITDKASGEIVTAVSS